MQQRQIVLVGAVLACAMAQADTGRQNSARADSHAPAGVMADHGHAAGEWMIGYRLQWDEFADLRAGSDSISAQQVADAGYSMAPTSMTMQMHMLDLMYAPSDALTLMLMPQYMRMEMEMAALPESSHGGDDHGHGHGHAAGSHSHSTEGWGDTAVYALLRLHEADGQRWQLNLGLSVPTGSVDEKGEDGKFVHYDMQLGSGTWDLLPGLTFSQQLSWGSLGAQFNGVMRTGGNNDSGYQLGNVWQLTGWSSYLLADSLALSARLLASHESAMEGHYNGPHNHSSPPDLQANYGGSWLDGGLGVNWRPASGLLARQRLSAEWLLPLYGDYNGIQLGQDYRLLANWSLAF